MHFEDSPQLPLTTLTKALLAAGAAMFAAQLAGAIAAAPRTTGAGNADAAVLFAMWGGSIAWSAVTVLLLVRQADLPTSRRRRSSSSSRRSSRSRWRPHSTRAAAIAEVNVVDTLFLGVTTGALTALIVWALAMAVARLLRLPTTVALRE